MGEEGARVPIIGMVGVGWSRVAVVAVVGEGVVTMVVRFVGISGGGGGGKVDGLHLVLKMLLILRTSHGGVTDPDLEAVDVKRGGDGHDDQVHH